MKGSSCLIPACMPRPDSCSQLFVLRVMCRTPTHGDRAYASGVLNVHGVPVDVSPRRQRVLPPTACVKIAGRRLEGATSNRCTRARQADVLYGQVHVIGTRFQSHGFILFAVAAGPGPSRRVRLRSYRSPCCFRRRFTQAGLAGGVPRLHPRTPSV